jgi:hypothetical protein
MKAFTGQALMDSHHANEMAQAGATIAGRALVSGGGADG